MKRELIENLLTLYLKDFDYKILSFEYNEDFFGNFIITLKSKKGVSIKLLRDKGQLFCEIKKLFVWTDINEVAISNEIFDMNEETELAISKIFKFLNDNMNKFKSQIL